MIQRAKKWFERNHPFIKMDRGQDLFPSERAKASAEAQLEGRRKKGQRRFQLDSQVRKLAGSVT